MKILVTGITGQLGHDVMKVLAARGLFLFTVALLARVKIGTALRANIIH